MSASRWGPPSLKTVHLRMLPLEILRKVPKINHNYCFCSEEGWVSFNSCPPDPSLHSSPLSPSPLCISQDRKGLCILPTLIHQLLPPPVSETIIFLSWELHTQALRLHHSSFSLPRLLLLMPHFPNTVSLYYCYVYIFWIRCLQQTNFS